MIWPRFSLQVALYWPQRARAAGLQVDCFHHHHRHPTKKQTWVKKPLQGSTWRSMPSEPIRLAAWDRLEVPLIRY